MNALFRTLQIDAEGTETLCPSHHTPMIEIDVDL